MLCLCVLKMCLSCGQDGVCIRVKGMVLWLVAWLSSWYSISILVFDDALWVHGIGDGFWSEVFCMQRRWL